MLQVPTDSWPTDWVVRSLNPDELHIWAELCEKAFSEKPNPPQATHFSQHFVFDPTADVTKVFVVVDPTTNNLIGSVRLYLRRVFFNGHEIQIGGIGEVCTLRPFRGRGVSRKLLTEALGRAASEHFSYISLHAAPQFRPLYEKFGFKSVNTQWVNFSIPQISPTGSAEKSCRIIAVECNEDTLSFLSRSLNSLFSGPVSKCTDYVSSWLRHETKNQVIAFFQPNNEIPAAYSIISEWPQGVLQLKDFGCGSEVVADMGKEMLCSMFMYSAAQCGMKVESLRGSIPKPLADAMHIIGDDFRVDSGWMIAMGSTAWDESCPIATNHLFWPVDHF